MKNKFMSLIDKILLLKRALIESVFGKIKLLGKFEHSRHRSVTNAFSIWLLTSSAINYQTINHLLNPFCTCKIF